jgi:hypothetical protein
MWVWISSRAPSQAKANAFEYAQMTNLTGKILKDRAVGGGSITDVFMGYWASDTTSTKVGV